MKLLKQLLILSEASVASDDESPKRQLKTKTKTKLDLGPKINHTIASAKDTAAATKGAIAHVTSNKNAMKNMDNLSKNMAKMSDEDKTSGQNDSEPQTPIKPNLLPKVITTNLKAAGFVDPKFHTVANLPGNMSQMIMKLGKSLFSTFTKTPTEHISMIAHMGGNGPNSKSEVNAVAAYCKKYGKDLGPGNIDFDKIMPGYEADIHLFDAGGARYMMVKDFMGEYVYAWPSENSIGYSKQDKLK